MVGYRVITTSFPHVHDLDEAKELALKGRGEGKRTEIITEAEYQRKHEYHTPMQDLTKL